MLTGYFIYISAAAAWSVDQKLLGAHSKLAICPGAAHAAAVAAGVIFRTLLLLRGDD